VAHAAATTGRLSREPFVSSRRRWLVLAALSALAIAVLLHRTTDWLAPLLGAPVERQLERAQRAADSFPAPKPAASDGGVAAIRAPASSKRLQDILSRSDHWFDKARDAAAADDAVLWVRAVDMSTICSDMRIARPLTEEMWRAASPHDDDKKIQEMVVFSRRMREMPAQRLAMPASFVETFLAMLQTSADAGKDVPRPVVEGAAAALDEAMIAPVSEADRAAREQLLATHRAQCADESASMQGFLDAYRRGRERWLAAGATGALLNDRRAGWSSPSMSKLSERDYALVERIVQERQPDGLAKLLSTSVAWQLSLNSEPEDVRQGFASMFNSSVIAVLAGCELGVNDCSARGPAFLTLCLNLGGCHLPDVGALARYALARDGLDPNWFDRESARVVKAIYEADLAAIGVHREAVDEK